MRKRSSGTNAVACSYGLVGTKERVARTICDHESLRKADLTCDMTAGDPVRNSESSSIRALVPVLPVSLSAVIYPGPHNSENN